jgi:hypothetical protein
MIGGNELKLNLKPGSGLRFVRFSIDTAPASPTIRAENRKNRRPDPGFLFRPPLLFQGS